jgi:LPXTG-motif cell wall-anchored protein
MDRNHAAGSNDGTPPSRAARVRSGAKLALVALGVSVVVGLAVGIAGPSSPSSAAPAGISQCNSVGSAGGDTITCTVTITNNFTYNAATPTHPTGAAVIVTTVHCTGSAVCPTGGTTTSTTPVTSITQCNTAGLGGASTVTCTGTVTNNLTGYPTGSAIASTIRQCQSPGTVNTLTCVATPAGNDRAGSGGPGGQSVVQCDGSGGPGGTMTCTATAPESQSTGLPITITQCNASGPAGASTVTCTATITNSFFKSTPPVTTPTTKPVTASTTPSATGVTSTTSPGSTVGGGATTTVAPGGISTTGTTVPIGPGSVLGGLGGGGATTGTLPVTGRDTAKPIAFGLLALLVGGLLVTMSRRRHGTTSDDRS